MAKYLAVHPVDPPADMDAVGPLAKKAKAGVTPDAYWVKSWCELNDDGQVTAALDDLRIAAGYPSTREEARSFLGQLQLRQNEITNIPFSQNFDGGDSNFVRGWPAGRVDDLAVVKLSDRPGQVLSWRRTVRDAEGDGILLAVRSLEIPERIRVAMRADSFDARLRVLVEDSDGRQWTSSVLLVPSDGWGIVDLAVAELVPADAPASRDRPVGVVVRRVEFRDVTAFHGLDRGENRIFLDDFALR